MQLEQFIPEKMLCSSNKYILGYRSGCLVIREINGSTIIQKLKIHKGLKAFTLTERLFRYEPRAACALADDLFLYSAHGAIYQYDVQENRQQVVHTFSRGMNNPLSFCMRRDRNGNPLDIVYGEYIWNTERGPVSIYKYDLNEWKEVYSFPARTVMHIHNIVFDEFNDRYIIMTGDEDKESTLWEADTDFHNVKMIVGGNQQYRACVAFPTSKGIFYATDTPLEQNWLYFLDQNHKLHEVHKMPGPCIYGRVFRDALYMATSVEGDPTLGGWKYRLSNKLGRGVYDRYVHIIRCDKDGVVEHIAKLKKDILPMWLFQFGNAQFPSSEIGVYISTQSTVNKGTYEVKFDG